MSKTCPLGQKYVQDMSETEIKVLKEIKKNNYARISEIARAIEKSDKTVSRAIKKLKELKYIERLLGKMHCEIFAHN